MDSGEIACTHPFGELTVHQLEQAHDAADSGPMDLKTAAVIMLILLTGYFFHVGVVHGVGVWFGGC